MDLRAYIHPPWRAEEWFEQSQFVTFTPGLVSPPVPIPIRGGAVPNGYRAVLSSAKVVMVQLDGISPKIGDPFEDFTGRPASLGISWSLFRNGIAVPGHQNRPANWSAQVGQSGDPTDLTQGWKTLTANFNVDIVVPVQLNQGDVLSTVIRNNNGSASFQVCAWFQGWIFPVVQDMDSAQGSAADPWGQ